MSLLFSDILCVTLQVASIMLRMMRVTRVLSAATTRFRRLLNESEDFHRLSHHPHKAQHIYLGLVRRGESNLILPAHSKVSK